MHLDLTAANVLIDEQTGMPVIIDFGLAFRFRPDQLRQQFDIGKLRDLFYVYFTKHPPWPMEVVALNHVVHHVLPAKGKSSDENKRIEAFLGNTKLGASDVAELRKVVAAFMANNRLFQPEHYLKHYRPANAGGGKEGGAKDAAKDAATDHFKTHVLRVFEDQWCAYFAHFDGKTWRELVDALLAQMPSWDNYGLAALFVQCTGSLDPPTHHSNAKMKAYRTLVESLVFYVPEIQNGDAAAGAAGAPTIIRPTALQSLETLVQTLGDKNKSAHSNNR